MKIRMTQRESEKTYIFVTRLEARLLDAGVNTYNFTRMDNRNWYTPGYENDYIKVSASITRNGNSQTVVDIKKTNC